MIKDKVKKRGKAKSDTGPDSKLPTLFRDDLLLRIEGSGKVVHKVEWGESYVLGFTGVRGAGKSLGMAFMAARAMVLGGMTVFSNLDIAFKCVLGPGMVKTYRSKPLDWDLVYKLDHSLQNGLICIDELQYFLSNRSSLSLRQRLMNAIIAQIRHRSLDFYFTAKSIGLLDRQFRYGELDIEIATWDISKGQPQIPKGHYFKWTAYDMSGTWTGRRGYDGMPPTMVYDFKYADKYWPIYSTEVIIDYLDTFRKTEVSMDVRYIGEKRQKEAEYMDSLATVVQTFIRQGILVVESSSFIKGIAEQCNVEANSNKIGRDLAKIGAFRRRTRSGSWYDLSRIEY